MKALLRYLVVVIAGLAPATPIMARDWRMVPAESQLEFVATYEGQRAPGEFRDFETKLTFDPRSPESGRLEVTVNLGSADMYSSDVNDAILQEEWLDAEKVGPAKFTSADIKRLGNGRFLARGTLEVKGVTQDLELPFTWEPQGRGAGMAGAVTLDRTDFNIGTGEWGSPSPIGVKVDVKFHVALEPNG